MFKHSRYSIYGEFLTNKFNVKTKKTKNKEAKCVVTRYMACIHNIAAFSVLAVRGRLWLSMAGL